MMKKNYLFGMMAASMLFAASCTNEADFEGQNGGEAMVSFKVATPEMATRAYSDGTTATKLEYAVYDEAGDILNAFTTIDGDAETINLTQTVNFQLTTDNTYTVIFWASNAAASYDFNPETKEVTVNYSNVTSNNENYDAFFACETFTVTERVQVEEITLKRPFAQLNIGASDYAASELAGYIPTQSYVKVSNIYNTLNLWDGSVANATEVAFNFADIKRDEVFPVAGYEYIAMNYLLVSKDKELVDIEFKYTDDAESINKENTKTRTIGSVPVQRNYRTNIYGDLLTSAVAVNVTIDPIYTDAHDMFDLVVKNDAELEEALRLNIDNIVIDLATETRAASTYNVKIGAWTEKYYFGGASTKSITINGNGNTINFIHENNDWNYIRCLSDDCKWIFNDVNLTNSGKNNGPWNRHNIRFYNAVELNNVTSDKAIALLNDATLNGVTITEDTDAYGLWITAEGQTVDIDGLNITSAGRGIAIKDQYVDAPAKVTLNVKNATFNTQKKAAVLVTSEAGADINWGEGNNIKNVAADPMNAVWSDKGFDQVTVNGCTKVMEGEIAKVIRVSNSEELQAAVDEAGDKTLIQFIADINGNVIVTQKEGINLLINGDGYKFDGTFELYGGSRNTAETLTIKGINFESADKKDFISCNTTESAKRYAHNVIVEGCTFKGNGNAEAVGLRYRQCYNLSVINCAAEGLHSLMQATGCTGVTINKVTLTNNKNGISFGTSTNLVVSNSDIVAQEYGIRVDGANGGKLEVSNTSINANLPIVARKMTTTGGYEVALTETQLTAGQEYEVVFTQGSDDAAFVAPAVEFSISGADEYNVFPAL